MYAGPGWEGGLPAAGSRWGFGGPSSDYQPEFHPYDTTYGGVLGPSSSLGGPLLPGREVDPVTSLETDDAFLSRLLDTCIEEGYQEFTNVRASRPPVSAVLRVRLTPLSPAILLPVL